MEGNCLIQYPMHFPVSLVISLLWTLRTKRFFTNIASIIECSAVIPSPPWILNANAAPSNGIEYARCRSSSIDRTASHLTSYHAGVSNSSSQTQSHRYAATDHYATLTRSRRQQQTGSYSDHVINNRRLGSSKFADTDEERLSPFSSSATLGKQVQYCRIDDVIICHSIMLLI